MARVRPDEAEIIGWMSSLSNWGRWGADDQLGTLNLVTPEHRRRAAELVREGVAVSCAWDIRRGPQPGVTMETQRLMIATGQGATEEGRRPSLLHSERADAALEFVGLVFHGYAVTHIDSLAHVFWDGKLYNGHSAAMVNDMQGARVLDVLPLRDGVVTRGVLLDVARAKGVDVLHHDDPVFPEDLEEAERLQGVTVGEGDVLFLRTGESGLRRADPRRYDPHRPRPGFQAACLPWLHDRGVAMLGSDVAQDHLPSGYPTMTQPVHVVGIVAMGLWLIDNCQLEDLAETCVRFGRWEFMLNVAALRLHGVTGSPVNPVAVF